MFVRRPIYSADNLQTAEIFGYIANKLESVFFFHMHAIMKLLGEKKEVKLCRKMREIT